jgi:hypothetical protein
MRKRASTFVTLCALIALRISLPAAALASGGDQGAHSRQAGEDRWVPSFSLTSGLLLQTQSGAANSVLFEDMVVPPAELRGAVAGDDLVLAPFFGFSLDVMTPALEIPTRPRFFFGAELIPTFGVDRDLAFEGSPDCVRGPLPTDPPCASLEDGTRRIPYGEDQANGLGTRTTATIDTLTYGAYLGASFPLKLGKREIRIKPSVAFMSYRVNGVGNVVDVACDVDPSDPSAMDQCTDITVINQFVGTIKVPGLRREMTLEADAPKRFYGIGPGLDIEMDTGRFGPVGAAIFVGGRAYAVLGERAFAFGTRESYDDAFGMDTAVAGFAIEVDPWIFRAHVGLRFQWLGITQ